MNIREALEKMIFVEIVLNSDCTGHKRKYKLDIWELNYWLERWWLPGGLVVHAEGSPPCTCVGWKVLAEHPQHPTPPAQMAWLKLAKTGMDVMGKGNHRHGRAQKSHGEGGNSSAGIPIWKGMRIGHWGSGQCGQPWCVCRRGGWGSWLPCHPTGCLPTKPRYVYWGATVWTCLWKCCQC